MKLYYVRHGQTDWNLQRKMQGGDTERPLNDTGRQQAEETKKKLENVNYDIIICSPMLRAKQTAEIINKGKDKVIVIDERLRERKLGELEGKPITRECENDIWNYELNMDIKGGENIHEFSKRVTEFFEEIKEKYKNKNVLVVAHGGVAKILNSYLYGMPKDNNLDIYQMKNCEIVEIEM